MKKILQQGHLDGFCLLYALANAFKVLKYPDRTASWFVYNQGHVWKKLVSVTPSLHNFASGEGSCFGVSTDRTDVTVKESFLELCAAVIGERKMETFTAHRVPAIELPAAIGKHSVALMCFGQGVKTERCTIGDHWVSVVDVDEDKYFLACSYADHLSEKVTESGVAVSPVHKRPFNNTIARRSVNKTTIVENSVYCFSMISN